MHLVDIHSGFLFIQAGRINAFLNCLSHPALGVNGWLRRTPPTGVCAGAMGVPSSSVLIGIADTHCTETQEEVDSKKITFPCLLGPERYFSS